MNMFEDGNVVVAPYYIMQLGYGVSDHLARIGTKEANMNRGLTKIKEFGYVSYATLYRSYLQILGEGATSDEQLLKVNRELREMYGYTYDDLVCMFLVFTTLERNLKGLNSKYKVTYSTIDGSEQTVAYTPDHKVFRLSDDNLHELGVVSSSETPPVYSKDVVEVDLRYTKDSSALVLSHMSILLSRHTC